MKPTVYIETTIVSYLTARLSTDVVRRGQQELTTRWWRDRRQDYALFTSRFALLEAAAGDPTAAAERMEVLNKVDRLEIGPKVETLAERLLSDGALPAKAQVDALHLAVAAVSGMQYLLTWNCKHLANGFLWRMIKDS